MTRNQFAMAVNADEKWVENTAQILGLSLNFNSSDVTWMGLVRVFNHDMGFHLVRSAELATEAMEYAPEAREVALGRSHVHEGAVLLDVARYHSLRNASLSAGLSFGGPRRRGRRARPVGGDALSRARKYGVDVDALRVGLADSPAIRLARLEQNAEFVDAMRKPPSAATRPRRRKKSKRKLNQ
jgi:hypothetical protein